MLSSSSSEPALKRSKSESMQPVAGICPVLYECTWIIDNFKKNNEKYFSGVRGVRTKTDRKIPPAFANLTELYASNKARCFDNYFGKTVNANHLVHSYQNYVPEIQLVLSLSSWGDENGEDVIGIIGDIKFTMNGAHAHRLLKQHSISVWVIAANGEQAFNTVPELQETTQPPSASVVTYRFILPPEEITKNPYYLPRDQLRIRALISCSTSNLYDVPFNEGREEGVRLLTLSDDLRTLFSSGTASDFEIHCGGQVFGVHQAILAARSPVFANMMTIDMKEKNEKVLIVEDIDPEIMKIFLEYIYSSELEIDTLESNVVSSLAQAANKYELTELKEVCFADMVENLNLSNAGDVAVLAFLHSAPQSMREKIFNFCAANWAQLASSKNFQDIHRKYPDAFHGP